VASWLLAIAATALAPGEAAAAPPTFSRDVAPIFQQKCQVCHRPGTNAPMSLLTYRDTRPWVRSIRQRVARREMPPWHIDRTIGIQKFKNDRSLTDEQIATILAWVDGGAPEGDPKDLPPPLQFGNDDEWAIGTPDLIVKSPEVKLYAKGPDWWPSFTVPTGLTEDRYVMAIETKPSKAGRFNVHHANVTVTQEADEFTTGAARDAGNGRVTTNFSEYVTGKYGDVFSDGSGRLLKAGSEFTFAMHYFASGEEIADSTSVGIRFYPKGYVPKYVSRWLTVEPGDDNDLDIPPGEVTRTDGYFRLHRPVRIDGFQPHMHMRGKAQCLIAIHPFTPDPTVNVVNTRGITEQEVLACVDRFDFNWQVAYMFDDDVAPLLPAGTILHAISIFDNTPNNRNNPDPTKWVGFGQRSVDEMANSHVQAVFLEDEDYRRLVAERKARAGRSAEPKRQP
jgi:mono/diheme cytochrome c family protein